MHADGTLSSENQETFCIHFSFFTLLPGYQSSHGTVLLMSGPATNYFLFPTVSRTKSRLWLNVQSFYNLSLNFPLPLFWVNSVPGSLTPLTSTPSTLSLTNSWTYHVLWGFHSITYVVLALYSPFQFSHRLFHLSLVSILVQ